MKTFLMTDRDILYANFMAIERHAYQAQISYYEKYEEGFYRLSPDKHLKVIERYLGATFDIGNYSGLLEKVNEGIDLCVECNWEIETRRAYIELIFKKAAAHYNLSQNEEAGVVCREVLKIENNHVAARELLRRVLANPQPAYILQGHNLAVSLMLIAGALILLDLFWIKNHQPRIHEQLWLMTEFIFITGLLLSFIPDIIHYFNSNKKMQKELRMLRQKTKKGNEFNIKH